MPKYLLPLIIFIALIALLARGLMHNDETLPSTLINKPAPAFNLATLNPERGALEAAISSDTFTNQIWLMHVFASWCVSCAAEHPIINQLATQYNLNILGFNYKDDPIDASSWLKKHGNPYAVIVSDFKGLTAIEYGVYGTPETFVIDRNGLIRQKYVGPLTDDIVQTSLLPLIATLNDE